MKGLRSHTHEERMAVARGLVPLLRRKFGDGLLAVAASASVARGDDRAYSDLELVVLLRNPPPADEDPYLQRVVDGLLVEADYVTEHDYRTRFATVTRDWYLAASDVLEPVHNPELVERIAREVHAIRHPREQFLLRAARQLLEVQESFGKTLNALDAGDCEAIGLLLWDAVRHTMITLAFLNEQPFTTFARFIPETRAFRLKPPRCDELLDRMVDGDFHDLEALRGLLVAVFEGMEALAEAEGAVLYDTSLDPTLPNRRYR